MKNSIAIDFGEFVNTFNEKGKETAIILAREKYNLSFQQLKRRMFNSTDYCFDRSLRLYKHRANNNMDTAEFMSIDELENKKTTIKGVEPLPGPNLNLSFDDLVKDLIKDRLLILNKYVTIDNESKQLIINTKKLKYDGFGLNII
ncbi:hypothetical protein [Clostridium pasteurianum]|uniref:Uncharacterized protein n=1 Tax=Clostridium pasteurianum BC1 TaxID=86416 RepID=R4K7U1_CLOPA|nr:hypothetical protein [Clostridium pasteurianum]AGK97126.1 hypothetical protein Clopa_2256 [Clostridium pasteurianum BC1]AGK97904.1 hypothetical protein Clopa_3082 [Clostridium pasteurianum BC1]AGK98618.1 hypothetical protein Clopa_3864 [Clostridium pasteurianum BC1]